MRHQDGGVPSNGDPLCHYNAATLEGAWEDAVVGGGALGDRALLGVTADEIAQGWRFLAETNCAADVYVMPKGVSPSFN